MPGLGPGIHVFRATNQDVDGRDKPGHDVEGAQVIEKGLAIGRAAGNRSRSLQLGCRVEPAVMDAAEQGIGGFRIDVSLADDAAKGSLDVAGRAAEAIIKVEMTEGGIEIVSPKKAHRAPAKPQAFGIGGGAAEKLLGFGKFVDLLGRLLGIGRRRWLLLGGLLFGILRQSRIGDTKHHGGCEARDEDTHTERRHIRS